MRLDIKGVISSESDGWIYDFWGIENCTPSVVRKAVEKARNEKAGRLDVYINSGGGDLAAGVEMYTELASAAVWDMKIHGVGHYVRGEIGYFTCGHGDDTQRQYVGGGR